MKLNRVLSAGVLIVASALGAGAFVYPFFAPAAAGLVQPGRGSDMMAHAADAPLLTVLLLGLCLVAVLGSLGARQMTSKMVALLGALTALSAAMRALPGPGGFNAIFLLPILAGYCYGPSFGFLLGALSLLVSAFLGAGIGPWLPYQMFAAGWVGLLSGLLPHPAPAWRRFEPLMLAAWGALLGLLFGAVMNLWFWPYLAGPTAATGAAAGGTAAASAMLPAAGASAGWQPGVGLWAGVRSYLTFYLATSLWWDLGRAAGNAILLSLLTRPVLRVLRRFRGRFQFEVVEVESTTPHPTQLRQGYTPVRR